MRTKLLAAVAGIAAAVALSVTPALAQSSGNVSGSLLLSSTVCSVESSGLLSATSTSSPGVDCPGDTSGNKDCTLIASTTIQTPNGSGTALEITPSLDVGLYTDTSISGGTSGKKQQSSANAEVMVYVTVDGNLVHPGGVVYDQRYQSLSGILGQVITSSCLTDSSCVDENIDLFLTTLSAHTFNLLYPVNGGTHVVDVYDQITDQTCTNGTIGTCPAGTTSNTASADACVGPGTLTVTQVKEYSQN